MAVEQHTCSLPSPGSSAARAAKKDMTTKIAELVKKARLTKEDGGDDDKADGKEDDEGVAASTTGDAASPPRCAESANSEDEDAGPAKRLKGRSSRFGQKRGTDKKRRFPTKNSLAVDIELLLRVRLCPSPLPRSPLTMIVLSQRTRPTFPTCDQLFPDIRSLLLQLYAWGEANDVCFKQFPSSSTRVRVYCAPDYAVPRCSFEIELRKADDGSWTMSVVNDTHDKVSHDKAAARGKKRPIPKDQADISSSSPSSSKKRPQTGPAPSSSSPTVPTSPKQHTPLPVHPVLVPLDVQSDDSLSLDHLTAFFASLSPSTNAADLSSASASLCKYGVSSVSDLTTLVQFEVDTLLTFVDEITEGEGWSEKEALVLENLLDAAKKAFEEEN